MTKCRGKSSLVIEGSWGLAITPPVPKHTSIRPSLNSRLKSRLEFNLRLYYIVLGKNRTICGKMVRKAIQTNITIRKGIIPRNIVHIGISLTSPETTKTLIPIGGVIKACSITSTIITPNHIPLKPRFIIIGWKRGWMESGSIMIN